MVAFLIFISMTKFYFSLISVFLIGCASFETGPEKLFLYEFEKNDKLNQSTITNTIDVLTKRLDKFGVNQVEISVNNKQQIEIKTKVELKQNALNNLIENSGKLEFWETYKGNEFNSFISEINSYLNEESEDHDALNNPLSDLIIDKGYPGGPVIFNVKTEDTSTVNAFLKNSKAKFFLPQDKTKTKFLWGKAYAGKHSLYAIKSNEENKAPIRSIHIVEANQNYDMRGKPAISIEMNGEGGSRFEELTEIVLPVILHLSKLKIFL